ncbi:MAG: segregation/condensation protein A, partial [Patescibacteria group bacterium]|nr:segregation/condensation protein A [Patescibacteria group bacterium]
MYEIKTESFEGPLSLLLSLIEEEKQDITTVSLARVTEGYLSRVQELGDRLSTGELADFLVVASRLLLIKSYVLLRR